MVIAFSCVAVISRLIIMYHNTAFHIVGTAPREQPLSVTHEALLI